MSFAEILRLGVAAGAYPEAAGQEQAWVEEWEATHQVDACDRELLPWDGTWVLASSRRMRHGGVIVLLIDIGVQKRAQSVLRDSEARLERAQEIAGLGGWDYDRHSGRYRLSRQAGSILELAGTAVLDRDAVLRHFSQDDQPAVDAWFRSLEAGQECPAIEATSGTRDPIRESCVCTDAWIVTMAEPCTGHQGRSRTRLNAERSRCN